MTLFVFAYGSLMWDGWERQFDGVNLGPAILDGHSRAFNKLSTRNWGSKAAPGPTLGLEERKGARCTGTVFAFADGHEQSVLSELRGREGPDFEIRPMPIMLEADKRQVAALVALNKRDVQSYVGRMPLSARAALVDAAVGKKGKCRDYVENVSLGLRQMAVRDAAVDEFVETLGKEEMIVEGRQWLAKSRKGP